MALFGKNNNKPAHALDLKQAEIEKIKNISKLYIVKTPDGYEVSTQIGTLSLKDAHVFSDDCVAVETTDGATHIFTKYGLAVQDAKIIEEPESMEGPRFLFFEGTPRDGVKYRKDLHTINRRFILLEDGLHELANSVMWNIGKESKTFPSGRLGILVQDEKMEDTIYVDRKLQPVFPNLVHNGEQFGSEGNADIAQTFQFGPTEYLDLDGYFSNDSFYFDYLTGRNVAGFRFDYKAFYGQEKYEHKMYDVVKYVSANERKLCYRDLFGNVIDLNDVDENYRNRAEEIYDYVNGRKQASEINPEYFKDEEFARKAKLYAPFIAIEQAIIDKTKEPVTDIFKNVEDINDEAKKNVAGRIKFLTEHFIAGHSSESMFVSDLSQMCLALKLTPEQTQEVIKRTLETHKQVQEQENSSSMGSN